MQKGDGAGNAGNAGVMQVPGTSWCWGGYTVGELGDDAEHQLCEANIFSGLPYDCSLVPVPVPSLSDVVMVEVGWDHTCALRGDGTVHCWGTNGGGQLGDGTTNDSPIPVQVAGLTDAVSISAGTSHACAVKADGRVHCWGLVDGFPQL